MPVPNGLHKKRTEELLAARGHDLRVIVAGWRNEGLGWPAIADNLKSEHGLVISRWTLARWFSEDVAA